LHNGLNLRCNPQILFTIVTAHWTIIFGWTMMRVFTQFQLNRPNSVQGYKYRLKNLSLLFKCCCFNDFIGNLNTFLRNGRVHGLYVSPDEFTLEQDKSSINCRRYLILAVRGGCDVKMSATYAIIVGGCLTVYVSSQWSWYSCSSLYWAII